MVFDCFMFFDELDLLEIRLNILNPVVDFFVITEATKTLMGNSKKMYFADNIDRFSKFRDKIIYNPLDMKNMEFANQWQREVYQKNYCINGIKCAKEDDIVIFSDIDEIPNPLKVLEIKESFDKDKIYHLAQNLYYFFMNYKSVDGKLLSSSGEFEGIVDEERKWLGTKICSYDTAKKYGMDALRHPELVNDNAIRVTDGGWHFSYMGGLRKSAIKRIKDKLAAFSHAEDYNNWKFNNPIIISFSILLGRDLFRRNAKFKKVKIDESYPEWLLENYKNYRHFIL